MQLIPDKIRAMKPYGFENADNCTVRLDANESFVRLPERLREKTAQIAREMDYNRYPDSLSRRSAEAYAGYIDVDPDYITAGNGSDELISIIISSLLDSGDSLLVADPDFSMYRFYSAISGVNVISAPKNDDMTLDPDALSRCIEENAPRAVIFSNPCSPTGQGLPAAELLALTERYPCLWIIDEAYMDFWNESIARRAIFRDNIIVLRTCSKAFGMAGLRLGFAITNSELTAALRKAKSPANVNSFTDAAAAAVISDKRYIISALRAVRESVGELYGILCGAFLEDGIYRVYPTKANFVYLTPGNTGKRPDIAQYLKNNGILIRTLGKNLRITAGSHTENSALGACLNKWKAEVDR